MMLNKNKKLLKYGAAFGGILAISGTLFVGVNVLGAFVGGKMFLTGTGLLVTSAGYAMKKIAELPVKSENARLDKELEEGNARKKKIEEEIACVNKLKQPVVSTPSLKGGKFYIVQDLKSFFKGAALDTPKVKATPTAKKGLHL